MVPLSASIFPTTHPLRDRATDLLVSLSPPHRSLVVILSACPSLPRRSSREENNNKRIRVARGKFLGPREGEESESREQQMTFAPVKRTYNDRFFFSREGGGRSFEFRTDLSSFHKFSAQVSRRYYFFFFFHSDRRRGGSFRESLSDALLLSSRMYRFYFALECRKVRFPSKQEDDFRSLFGQAKIS